MKIALGSMTQIHPMPTILVGAMGDGKANFTPLANCGQVSRAPNPFSLYISSRKEHHINKCVLETGVFSVNIPSFTQAVETDYCGLVSGRDTDKSGVFKFFFGETGAPVIENCPVSMDCRVVKVVDIFNMDMFIGEVVNCYVDERCLTDGKPDGAKINPLIYDTARLYRSLGGEVLQAFRVGRDYRPE